MRRLTPAEGEAAVAGGSLLGGGGGGDAAAGMELCRAAFEAGPVWLAAPGEVPAAGPVFMAALVGAPAAAGAAVSPEDYWQAAQLLAAHAGPPAAFITNENGGLATVNGWYQAARMGVPVLDCPGNGRAHPTALMGSLNLDLDPGYRSVHACCGGAGLRLVVEGSMDACARLVRMASVEAGGLVAVARNPVGAAHVAANGAAGAITQAIEVGRAMLTARSPAARLAAAVGVLGPSAAAVRGCLESVALTTAGGFDCGQAEIVSDTGQLWRLRFFNEYITAEIDGRVGAAAVFPDLIATFDLATGWPASTAALGRLERGHPVGIVIASRSALRLAATMKRADLMAAIGRALGLERLPEPVGSV